MNLKKKIFIYFLDLFVYEGCQSAYVASIDNVLINILKTDNQNIYLVIEMTKFRNLSTLRCREGMVMMMMMVLYSTLC